MTVRTKLPLARLAAEGLVIVAGVLIALAVDRWAAAIDDRALEASYLSRLIENLEADSAEVALRIRNAEDRNRLAVQVLSGSAMADTLRAEEWLERLEQISWFAPVDYARDAWDELVAGGNLFLIRDPTVRESLSAYYNRIEWVAGLEGNWNADALDYFARAQDVLPPLVRLQVLGVLPEDVPRVAVDREHVRRAVRVLTEDPERSAELGTLAVIYGVQVWAYEGVMDDIAAVLRLLREASSFG